MWKIDKKSRVEENIEKEKVEGKGIEMNFMLLKMMFKLIDMMGEIKNMLEMVGKVMRDGEGICKREM